MGFEPIGVDQIGLLDPMGVDQIGLDPMGLDSLGLDSSMAFYPLIPPHTIAGERRWAADCSIRRTHDRGFPRVPCSWVGLATNWGQ